MNPKMFLAILIALPLIIDPGLFLNTESIYLIPKIRWIYLILLPSILTLIFLSGNFRKLCSFKFIVIFFIVFLLAGIWNWNDAGATWMGAPNRGDGIVMHLVYLAVSLAGITIASQISTQRTFLYLATGAAVLSLTAILQQLEIVGVLGIDLAGTSATVGGGTLGNRGYMGGALALLLPLSIWVARNRPGLWSYAGLIIVTWGLSATMTRGAWIAGLAGACILWITRQLTLKVILVLSAGIALSLAPAFFLPNTTTRSFSGDSPTAIITNNSGRTVLYRSALIGITERPLLGWGGNALWKVMAERSDQELLAEGGAPAHVRAERRDFGVNAPPSFILTLPTGEKQWFFLPVNKVHNEYLDYALTYGIPAAVLFTLLLGYGIWNAWTTAPVLSACLVAYGVYLLTWPEVIRFAPIAWFLLGLALAQRRGATVET
ncbi:hypothetical protein CBQ26_01010 [Deinococcus indicus]|uniref:O-antigen ligase-related domain-containing protein n=1 Tax=Deinococcus indicus TaxID=223556 RepID=A0A246BT31_9DEIO|nr:O-antigen ligase family protein [Deinococcus indicus]OWL98830.1 hypothetical protein CBQ26_01010 [Deinococcus indicus]